VSFLACSYYNAESHSFDVERYSNNEPAYVDQVKMLFDDSGEKKYRVSDVAARSDRLQRVFIMLRIMVSRGRLIIPPVSVGQCRGFCDTCRVEMSHYSVVVCTISAKCVLARK